MRVALAIVVAIVACRRADRAEPARSWWCWTSGAVCFADRARCEHDAAAIQIGERCEQREIAYCKHGCRVGSASGEPSCSVICAGDRDACEHAPHDPRPCRAEAPPGRPELFPTYVDAEWWCWSYLAASGNVASSCGAAREKCEWERASLVAKGAQARSECAATAAVWCWSRVTPPPYDDLAFACATSADDCERTRAHALSLPEDKRPLDPSMCAAWEPSR